MAIIALWQWQRVGALPTVPVTSLRYYGQRSRGVHDALALLAPTLLLGVLATASFCAALVAIRRATAQAMQSRDALMQAFENGRRWLPKFMLSQTVLVFGGLITLLSFEAIIILSRPGVSDGGVKGVFLAMVALALAWYGFKMLYGALRRSSARTSPNSAHGPVAGAASARAPVGFVREIAKRTDARARRVVVGLNEGFFVTEHPVALVSAQPVPGARAVPALALYGFPGSRPGVRRDRARAWPFHRRGHGLPALRAHLPQFPGQRIAGTESSALAHFRAAPDRGRGAGAQPAGAGRGAAAC